MYGWNGTILRVNLTKEEAFTISYDSGMALNFLGGRGFAVKILWDELTPGIDALSSENKLIFATGPLTALSLPSSGKLVVAAKSPLTGGYGDGNLGSTAAVHLRRSGYDAIVIDGKARKPSVLWIVDNKKEIVTAEDVWGKGTFETEKKLKEKYGESTGVLSIGPAGEKLVKYANIVSQEGRAGGRPGIGAVMGSKKLKAIAIKGSKSPPIANQKDFMKLGEEAYKEILNKPSYSFWRRQGTMSTLEWSQENSVLPTNNFREGVFDDANTIGGFATERIKVSQKGCPNCNMICGNVVEDSAKDSAELDYENVAMLGSNIGIGDLREVATLNRMADDYGLDTISLGNVIGFVMEISEKKLVKKEVSWGDFEGAKSLIEDVATRHNFGAIMGEGVQFMAEKVGGSSSRWAMHVKGLEISGYDCHSTPGMALSYGTSSIGAHHKDAWIISWEVAKGREGYTEAKVDKIIELQRLRGGVFESLTTCRLPWVELGFQMDWYPKFLKAVTGINLSLDNLFTIADRSFNLIRSFWVREYSNQWSKNMDNLPTRWFEEPTTKGPLKGAKLDREKYERLLEIYYAKRGWDNRGIPTKETLTNLQLEKVAQELQQYITLSD